MTVHRNGFTLIEVAIVLVIIGLLLGGILKGQELITGARVRNLISQQDGIKAAFFGFQDPTVHCQATMQPLIRTSTVAAARVQGAMATDALKAAQRPLTAAPLTRRLWFGLT